MWAGVLSTLLIAGLIAGLPACGATSKGAKSIVVFAAASLRSVFTQLQAPFVADNPGSVIDFNFVGSSELAIQLTQGAPADVFASADAASMDMVAKAGLLAAEPTNFASNTLVIVTGPGNPKNIQSLADLAGPGLSVVVCQRPVPCGSAAHLFEDTTGVRLAPASEEPNVTDVLNKVTTGQADAGLVYITDARSAGNAVTTIKFPEATAAINVYPIAVLNKAAQPSLAQKFVALVISVVGQHVLAQSGFAKP